jgi:CheY-like chemotaxis protein
LHEHAPSKGTDEGSLYVDSVEIAEFVPTSLCDAQLEAAVLRSFLNVFNNLLYVLIKNSRDALKQMTSDQVAYGQVKDIASAADQLDAATKRLQRLVEGVSDYSGTGTILVADDQASVRNLVVKTLEQYGYTVLGVSSGLEALEKCKAYPGPIHLMLADVGMEPMDGYELVRRVLLVRSNTKAIYMSGNFLDPARAMPGTAFLLKPGELVEGLPQRVWQMLNRP